MCNWKKWIWPGLLATVLLTALAMIMKSGHIEKDLEAKALNDLSGSHGWAKVGLDGRDLTLTGMAPSEEAASEALQIARDAYDVRVAASNVELLPIADPYTLSAVKDADNKITLTGHVPSDAVRANIVSAAEAANGDAEVVDEMALARGAPAGFGALAAFGISQLSGMTEGSAALNASDLTVKGNAKTAEDFEAIEMALKNNLPAGANLAAEEVASPAISPYTFAATENESGVLLTGYVPDEATRAELVAQAEAVTDGTVTDQLEIGPGAPDGFAGLAGFGIERLGEFSTGSASLSDLGLSVRGTALSPDAYNSANTAIAGTIPANGKVVVSDITRSTVSPYTFSASKDNGIIVLEGYVGSDGDKAAAVDYATVQNPGDRVIDRLVVANGAPDGVNWPEANQLAIKEASQLLKGASSLKDNMFTVEGMAKSNKDFDGIKSEANGTLPAGLKLAKEDVQRPVIKPYVWSFSNMDGAAPTLSGYVPEENLSGDNIAQVEARLGTGTAVANGLEVGAGAPGNLAAATSVGIQAASRLYNGKAEISGTQLMVSGEALSAQAAAQIRAGVENGVPPGFIGKHNITVREAAALPTVEADECQTLLTNNLKNNSIQFETAKAVIKEDSYGLLDRLAFVVKRCPTAIVEIEGHTDSDGSGDYNQGLSEERANAVRSHLVGNGIFVGRLKAVGYGETKPIADNSTEEGKAQNRRIEFTVVR